MSDALKILLVEDEQISAMMTTRLLGKLGCDVVHVEDGQAAVDACADSEFNLILMDLGLGEGIDGVETTKIILSDGSKNKDTPVVALTARDTEEDRSSCFEAGMKDYYVKPASQEKLEEMLEYARLNT